MINEAMIAEAVKKAIAELNTDDKNEIKVPEKTAQPTKRIPSQNNDINDFLSQMKKNK